MLCIRSLVVKQGSFLRLFLSQTHLQSFYCILTYNLPTDVLKRRQRAFSGIFWTQYALHIALWIADIPPLSA